MKKIPIILSFLSFLTFANDNVFKSIKFEGDNVNNSKLVEISNRYKNKEMNRESITQLINLLNENLQNEGYINSTVAFKEGNVNNGELVLTVLTNRINEIKIVDENNKEINQGLKTKFAFGNYENRVLNVRDLDQQIENLNVLGSKHFMKIIDSDKVGYSDIIIIEKTTKSDFFEISLDNNTSRPKSANLSLSYTKTNLFKANDTLSISYLTELNSNLKEYNKNIVSLKFKIPYNKFNITYDLSTVINNQTLKGNVNQIKNSSYLINSGIKLDYMLKRTEKSKLLLNLEAGIESKKTYIQNNKIDVASNTKYILGAGLSYETNLFGGNLLTSAKIMYKTNENTQFKVNTNWNKLFIINENTYLEFNNKLGLEFSKNSTYIYNIRGFSDGVLEGKKKFYAINDLGLKFNNNKFNPYIGLDFAITEKGSIIGATIGLKYSIQNLSMGVSYSRGIKTIEKNKLENKFMYSISYTF